MKVLGKFFLNSRKERRKDEKTEFFVRCRRTYVLKKMFQKINQKNPKRNFFLGHPVCITYSFDRKQILVYVVLSKTNNLIFILLHMEYQTSKK